METKKIKLDASIEDMGVYFDHQTGCDNQNNENGNASRSSENPSIALERNNSPGF